MLKVDRNKLQSKVSFERTPNASKNTSKRNCRSVLGGNPLCCWSGLVSIFGLACETRSGLIESLHNTTRVVFVKCSQDDLGEVWRAIEAILPDSLQRPSIVHAYTNCGSSHNLTQSYPGNCRHQLFTTRCSLDKPCMFSGRSLGAAAVEWIKLHYTWYVTFYQYYYKPLLHM